MARAAAATARALVKAGKDPIQVREAERDSQRRQEARGLTFDQAVQRFLDGHESSWRNPKHRQQWRNTLATYASPAIGHLSVAEIRTGEVTRVRDPIWKRKQETASRLRGRIERVLDWAKVRGHRDGENPTRWRGHLDKVFAARAKVRQVKHHAATLSDDMPAVYARLRESKGTAALRFVILTAGRAGEITGSLWPEIDRSSAIWTVVHTEYSIHWHEG
jgi:hypothetical protein